MQHLYSTLADDYDEIIVDSIDTEKEIAFLHEVLNRHKSNSVLDVACGSGRHSVGLAKLGYRVVGIDYSENLLRLARNKVKGNNPVFIKQDVTDLKLDKVFDVAICMWSTFGEIPYKELLKNLPDLLSDGSLLILDIADSANMNNKPELKFENTLRNGETVKTIISQKFVGNKRIRDIQTIYKNKKIHDHVENTIFTKESLTALLESHGFTCVETYYDYENQPMQPDSKRLQAVFQLSKQ